MEVVRCEEREDAAADEQLLGDGPRERAAVAVGRAAAELVDEHEAVGVLFVQNTFHHLLFHFFQLLEDVNRLSHLEGGREGRLWGGAAAAGRGGGGYERAPQ